MSFCFFVKVTTALLSEEKMKSMFSSEYNLFFGISPRGKARDFDSLFTGSNPVIPA